MFGMSWSLSQDGMAVFTLGPDRFRIINTAAREALVLGGFAKESKDGETKKKTKK